MIHIKKLIEQHGGQIKLAAAMGKGQGQISKWLALDAWVDVEAGKVYTPSSNFEWQSGQSGAIVEAHS